jgi:hypothetical protein
MISSLMEQASSAPRWRTVFISPPPHPGPRPGRGGLGGCRRPPFGLGGPPEPPMGAFRASFRRNLGEIWGPGGQKRLRNAREHTQETLGARRPRPPVDRAGVHGSRGRRRGQRARGCVWDRHGFGGVPKGLFRGPGDQNRRKITKINEIQKHAPNFRKGLPRPRHGCLDPRWVNFARLDEICRGKN